MDSKFDVKWLLVEMWILKDFWPICGLSFKALWRRKDSAQSGDFRADQDSGSGSQGARFSTLPLDKKDLIWKSGFGL